MKFDFIIIGAGFAGITIAERIATQINKKVLIIEKRNHIGGNCYDCYDKYGILIHLYGPHIFRTDNEKIWGYLSQYTDWINYRHRVLGFVDNKKVPIPFNLNALSMFFKPEQSNLLKQKLINTFGFGTKIPILKMKQVNDVDLRNLAYFIYNKIYLNYTLKQWGMKIEDLDHSVTERVPVSISYDDCYFQDKYQGIPRYGYTALFGKMLSNSNIKILLNTDFKEVITFRGHKIFFLNREFKGLIIFTGKIDELFNYEFGELPYRSLRFEFENMNQEFFQEAAVINYPNNFHFTRITEFKHLTKQKHYSTTIAREFPQDYDRHIKGKDIPYYPIPRNANKYIYNRYLEKAKSFKNMILLGRLAEYKYYQMDQVVERALEIFENRILKKINENSSHSSYIQ